jgi:GNAT superfamily N-acetyltransferase
LSTREAKLAGIASYTVDSLSVMDIRRATDADWPDFFRMASLLALDAIASHDAHRTQFAAAVGDDRSAALVATDDGRVVGYVLGGCLPMPLYGGQLAMLQELYVDESHRRAGVARALVEAFTAWADERGAAIVGLATSRHAARAFYESQGFVTRPTTYYWRRIQ